MEFNDTATAVTVMSYTGGPVEYRYYRSTFSIEGLFEGSSLEYLALGDSFSSGEGDTETKYYKQGTDVLGDKDHPMEMCHVSNRSYPFLLREWLKMSSGMTESVACSGAVVKDDYTGSEKGYNGQNSRLAQMPSAKKSDMKEEALGAKFIPGRVKQISFVRKYQPKAVTITGGGNDVGFAGILTRCGNHLNTCQEATNLSKIRSLGANIQSQYVKLVSLYSSLHEASPRTKIYVIGYPQFVSSKDDPCFVNVGLNKTERKFVREGVTMMNSVIKAAADTAGVEYIDIEDSLGDYTLCGAVNPFSWYVTGISKNEHWTKDNGRDFFSSESLHPNAKGHHAMANAIKSALRGKSPVDHSYCQGSATMCPKMAPIAEVPLTPFFAQASAGGEVQKSTKETFAPQFVQPKVNPKIKLYLDMLKRARVIIRMESTPRILGEADVGDDGVLDTEVTIPVDVEAGFHTLYIDALSASGEPITLWQHITVQGPNGDLDDNGVEDILQPCPFITGVTQDSDTDGIDDRCDPEIGYAHDTEEKSIPLSQYSNIVNQLRSSTMATVGARDLLKSESQLAIQHFLGSNNSSTEIASISDQTTQTQHPSSHAGANTGKIGTPRVARPDWFKTLSISISTIMCILIAGLLYARIFSKKS